MKDIKKLMITLVALLAVTTGAWAQTEENIFQYCYDCQRSPAYPKTTASASLSGFANPLVGYKGSGFGVDNTSAGPWKLEYMGIWSTTDKHGIDDVSYYQDTYNCTDVPVFRLYQWNATANEYQHAAYGVVCCYANVSNAVEHTALFEAEGGWGCVLTNSSHSSSMNITFDEDLSSGLTTLIAAATPNASAGSAVTVAWNKASKTGTFGMPGGNVELEPEYYPQAALTAQPTAINDVPATTDGAIVKPGTVKNIGETTTAQGTVMYYVSPTALDDAALLALAADAWKAEVPTAESLAKGQAYVYYYVRGNDGDTDETTFSDSDIMPLGTNGIVNIAAAPTYAVTFADDLAEPTLWTASPNTGVTKGDKVTVTYTGSKKVLGVKAEKKAKTLSVTIKGRTIIFVAGDSWEDALKYPENKNLTINNGKVQVSGYRVYDGNNPVQPSETIDASKTYSGIME